MQNHLKPVEFKRLNTTFKLKVLLGGTKIENYPSKVLSMVGWLQVNITNQGVV